MRARDTARLAQEGAPIYVGDSDRVCTGELLTRLGRPTGAPGHVAQVWVYNSVLSQKEIDAVWRDTHARYPPPPPAPPPKALDWGLVSGDHTPPTWDESLYLQSLRRGVNAAPSTEPGMVREPAACGSADCAQMRELRLRDALRNGEMAEHRSQSWSLNSDRKARKGRAVG